MSEQIWYVYQNGQQLGPFAVLQLKQMIDSKMIPQDAYLFKVGWKDWRPIEETHAELGLTAAAMPDSQAVLKTIAERRDAAPRATISGRVVVHNNSQMVIGSGVNISATGMFVETTDQIFAVGERLKLSVRVEGFARPFNVLAQVVRYNGDPKFPVGYGLRFDEIDQSVAAEIQAAIDRQNRAQAVTQQAAK
ncbi:MAG: DUF4339 domain-containing protein [Deltaproteobacteria bacterium]|nr:DUF4339 domain-containing protein [Deltaproteobacteria bacterium]